MNLNFDRAQLLCLNEVFPEAAVSDPFADLEVWNEWRTGVRAFPYPGKYSRLGISLQEGKTSSTTSTGVIGELFAGVFSQVGIAPWVLVRVIQRWPDFIYYTGDGRYAFVEAKAFDSLERSSPKHLNVPNRILGKCLLEAAQQLNTDPFVKIWLSFTGIRCIDPFKATVTFIELDAPNRRREKIGKRVTPPPVVRGIAHRSIVHAASDIDEDDLTDTTSAKSQRDFLDTDEEPGRQKTPLSKRIKQVLIRKAIEGLDEELPQAVPDELMSSARQEIEGEIKSQVAKAYIPEAGTARRFEQIKTTAVQGRLAKVRLVNDKHLYMADLPSEIHYRVAKLWTPDWRQANQPLAAIGNCRLWRGSSAVLALAGPELNDIDVREAVMRTPPEN